MIVPTILNKRKLRYTFVNVLIIKRNPSAITVFIIQIYIEHYIIIAYFCQYLGENKGVP